jgi:hypothetical protein
MDIELPHRETPIALVALDGVSSVLMFAWMQTVTELLQAGFTGTITTAPLTGGGTTGSMTFENGVLIDQTPAT